MKSLKHKSSLSFGRWTSYMLVMASITVLASILALTSGELDISISELFSLLAGKGDQNMLTHQLVMKVRLPRVILGFAVGGALSLSGVILQGIYRNPLVEPYTLGISGGASLGVAAVIVLGLHQILGSFMLPLAGFSGSLLIIFLVYFLSRSQGRININNMLLTGVMISFIASASMMFLMAVTSADNLHGIIFWIMGSLDETNQTLINWTLAVSVLILFTSYLFVQPLNALRLGQEKANHLGINTTTTIKILFLLASLLAGISVAVAGVIGFVGLIIPHLMRMIFGTDYRIILSGSFLMGGTFVILSDIIARTIIAPNELPIGVITGMVGGLVFILLMRGKSKWL